MIPFIFSQHSITIVLDGKPTVISADHSRYAGIIDALREEDDERVRELVAIPLAALSECFGEVEVYGGHVTFKGQPIHNYLVTKILEFNQANLPIAPLAAFLSNVMQNPSRRATEDLYAWCEAGQLPITDDGCIVAYKIVNADFTDCYSGKFDNSPGMRVQVDRNAVDDNPDNTCSHGLHFCSAAYLPHYGSAGRKVVLVKVNPADVVAFPRDYNLSKARCCGYDVLQEIDGDTAASFFHGSGPVYSTVTVTKSDDQVFAESEGYRVEQDDDGDWQRGADGEDLTPSWHDTEEEAWAAAAADARASSTGRIEALETYLGITPKEGDSRIGTVEYALGLGTDQEGSFDERLSRCEEICHLS